jgi:hypothetical protein
MDLETEPVMNYAQLIMVALELAYGNLRVEQHSDGTYCRIVNSSGEIVVESLPDEYSNVERMYFTNYVNLYDDEEIQPYQFAYIVSQFRDFQERVADVDEIEKLKEFKLFVFALRYAEIDCHPDGYVNKKFGHILDKLNMHSQIVAA